MVLRSSDAGDRGDRGVANSIVRGVAAGGVNGIVREMRGFRAEQVPDRDV
jgi:hypothetical protein